MFGGRLHTPSPRPSQSAVMPRKRVPAQLSAPVPGAEWIDVESETDVAYLYDDGHFSALAESAMAEEGGAFWACAECHKMAERGIVLPLFFTVRGKDDGLHAFVYVGEPPAPNLLATPPLSKTQRGRLYLPTGRLRIETHSALRIGPTDPVPKGLH